MGSRDFGFITLRNISAYQQNGNPVPQNQLLATSRTGEASFTNNLNISTISVHTEFASSINTNFLTVNSTTLLSTTIINNSLALIGNTPADSEIWLHNYKSRLGTSDPYAGLFLQASTTQSINFSNIDATTGIYASIGQEQSDFFGSVNIASTLNASTLNTNQISTNNIQTTFISTFNHITLFEGTNPVILDAEQSTLFVNGHPVMTGGQISSISSLFWLPGPNGTIYNENIGIPPNYYEVGIGSKGSPLNALLEVSNNIYSSTKNVFNVSSFNNRFTIDNINSSSQNYMSARLVDNQDNPFGISLKFEKSINLQSTIPNCELGYIDFYGTNPSLSTVRGAYILARQQDVASTFAPTDLQFVTCSTLTENINMVITSQGNVGIGTVNPQAKLAVNGNVNISSGSVVLEKRLRISPAGDGITYIQTGDDSGFPDSAGDLFFGNWFEATATSSRKIMFLANGNVGINTTTPQTRLDVNGPTMFGSTNRFIFDSTMATGQKGMSFRYESNTGFIQAEEQDVAFRNLALNPFGGNVGIGTQTPQTKLDVNGNINSNTIFSPVITATQLITSNMNFGGLAVDKKIALVAASDNNDQFIRFRTGGSPEGRAGLIFSAFDGTSYYMYTETNGNFNINRQTTFSSINGQYGDNLITVQNNSGNVGIGTTNPQAKLDVNGTIRTSGYLSTNTIQMNSGGIVGVNTINGAAYPPTGPSISSKDVFTLPGSSTFTLPASGTYNVEYVLIGGGGGGGGGGQTTPIGNGSGAGGGGGGETRRGVFIANGGDVIPFTVGFGGSGGNSNANGGNGSVSEIQGIDTATAGFGGISGIINGGNGGAGVFGGGGGGSTTAVGVGGIGTTTSGQNGTGLAGGNGGDGGPGGSAVNGGGGGGGGNRGGNGGNGAGANGGSASIFGSGGGGGAAAGNSPSFGGTGGNGGTGVVMFIYTLMA